MGSHQLGEFEELILLAVQALGDGAYTVSIQMLIEEKAGRTATLGSIYTTLSRLFDKGYVMSKKGEVTPRKGGKRKRFYSITPAGSQALYEARRIRNSLWEETSGRPSWILS